MARQNQIGSHKTTIYNDGEYTCVKYWSTDVVKFNDKEIILNTGGHFSSTTKTRMNQAFNHFGLKLRVYQKDYQWYISHENSSKVIEFGKDQENYNIHRIILH